jgi:multisubunit Na+/H+ antiporter MnhE subunit
VLLYSKRICMRLEIVSLYFNELNPIHVVAMPNMFTNDVNLTMLCLLVSLSPSAVIDYIR